MNTYTLYYGFGSYDYEYEINMNDALEDIAEFLIDEYKFPKECQQQMVNMLKGEDFDLSIYDDILKDLYYDDAYSAWEHLKGVDPAGEAYSAWVSSRGV